jgi:hypothetical protein
MCGIRVSGEELFALSQPPSAEMATAKTGRLRLHYCARQGCDSCYYDVTLHLHEALNWAQVLAPKKIEHEARSSRVSYETVARTANVALVGARKLWPALVTLMLLLVLRQWYLGGRIPLIREPEKFHVDTAAGDPAPELNGAEGAD